MPEIPKISYVLKAFREPEKQFENAVSTATGFSLPPGPAGVLTTLAESIESSAPSLPEALPAFPTLPALPTPEFVGTQVKEEVWTPRSVRVEEPAVEEVGEEKVEEVRLWKPRS